MSRLVDRCPNSDDESPEASILPTAKVAAAPISPVKPMRDLVPKSTVKPSARKIRRLGDATPRVNNPLFRKWNAEEDDGDSLAMRGSPSKARSPIKTRQSSRAQNSFLQASQLSLFDTETEVPQSRNRPRTARRHPDLADESNEEVSEDLLSIVASGVQENGTVAASSSAAHDASQLSVGEVLDIEKLSIEDKIPDEIIEEPSAELEVIPLEAADREQSPSLDSVEDDPPSPDNASDSDFSLHNSSHEASRDLPAKLLFGRPKSRDDASGLSPYKNAPSLQPRQASIKAPTSIFDEEESYSQSWTTGSFLSLQSGASLLGGTDFKKPLRLKKQGQSTTQDLAASLSNLRIEFGEGPDKSAEATGSERPSTPPPKMIKAKSLVSPSKKTRIPSTPHHPNTETFWSQDVVDDWNDQHSPRKVSLPPINKSPFKRSPNKAAKKSFAIEKHALAEAFIRELDEEITEGKIGELAASTGGVKIIWSRTLNTTAGRANWKKETIQMRANKAQLPMSPSDCLSPAIAPEIRYRHYASIELAEKVIDDEERLLNVLAHEWCHLANFMINGQTGNPHGREFKAWAARCSKAFGDRGIEVTTKHAYEIDFKYLWACADCSTEYKRHSKSIDPSRHRCGKCKGMLQQIRPVPRGVGNGGAASEYQTFMKEQMKIVRLERPGSPQKDIMKVVAERWAAKKGAAAGVEVVAEAKVAVVDEEDKENDEAAMQLQMEREMAEEMGRLALEA